MVDPELALKAAVSQALNDIGVIEISDEEIDGFLIALKERGYIVIPEINGVFPGDQSK